MSQAPFPQQPNPQFQQGPGQPYPPQQPAKPKKKWYRRVWVWILIAIVFIVIVANGNKGGSEAADTATVTGSVPAADTNASMKAEASANAAAKASQQAEASASAAAKASAEAAALKDPSSYKKLTDREFSMIVKDPESHKGEKVVLYGYVQQLDSATGPDVLLAGIGGSSKENWYEYQDRAIVVAGEKGMYQDVVQKDLVTIYATVNGSMSYDTQIGGNTTVPKLTANIIKVTGNDS